MNSIAGRPIGRPASLCSAAVAGQTWSFFETPENRRSFHRKNTEFAE